MEKWGECNIVSLFTKGDEGDPLVDYNANVQVGVVSHGSSSSCQDRNPAVYSRLTSYIEWISMNTGIPLS